MIEYFLILGLFLDLFLTYKFLDLYRTKYKGDDYVKAEANFLIRYCIRKFGLKQGIIISGTIIFLLLLVLIAILPKEWKYFFAGVYYMMVVFHFSNFLAIKSLGGKNNEKDKSKRTRK